MIKIALYSFLYNLPFLYISEMRFIDFIAFLFNCFVMHVLLQVVTTLRQKRIVNVLSILVLLLICFLDSYALIKGQSLNFSVFIENINILFNLETLEVASSFFKVWHYVYLCMMLLGLCYILLNAKPVEISIFKEKKSSKMIWLSSYLIMLTISFGIFENNFVVFAKSFKDYYENSNIVKNYQPYRYQKTILRSVEQVDRPNIFIIFIESFNANILFKRGPLNKEITPFINKLASENTSFNNFYGNSVQTIKGQISTLCGILPSFRGKISFRYPNLKLKCLPEFLKPLGYETLFFKAHENINYDNTKRFFQKNGFQHLFGMSQEFQQDVPEEAFWHWGMQDNYFYKNFFKFYDKEMSSSNKKIFAALTTVSNHMMFDKIPKRFPKIYSNPQNTFEHYANSMHVTDLFLTTFFDELNKRESLKNNIVVLLGDHSYPIGEHQNYFNEVKAFNENFKTPLIIVNNSSIEIPQSQINTSRSQIDIAPTLLNLLQIQENHHLIGKNLFSEQPNEVYLIQPYDGRWLSYIQWPYKFMKNYATKEKLVYNLESDPLEKSPLPITNVWEQTFRDFELFLFTNQKMIEQNEIFK